MDKDKNKRSLGLRATVALAAVLATLLVAELGARFAFKLKPASMQVTNFPWMTIEARGLRLVANTHANHFARINSRVVPLDINSNGFRGPELRDPGQGSLRILFLGDSITFGPGLFYEETIPARLGSLLGPRAQAVNAGVPGMSTKDEVDFFIEKKKAIKPDLVILGFYLNDSVRSIVLSEEYGNLGEFWVNVITRLRRSSALANRLWEGLTATRAIKTFGMKTEWVKPFNDRKWVSDRKVYEKIIELSDDDFGAAWKDESWPVIEKEIIRLKNECRSVDARLAIVIFPVSLQLKSEVADDLPQKRMKAIAEKQGVPALDLLPHLKPFHDKGILYDQCHYTPGGADLAANIIAKWVREKGFAE